MRAYPRALHTKLISATFVRYPEDTVIRQLREKISRYRLDYDRACLQYINQETLKEAVSSMRQAFRVVLMKISADLEDEGLVSLSQSLIRKLTSYVFDNDEDARAGWLEHKQGNPSYQQIFSEIDKLAKTSRSYTNTTELLNRTFHGLAELYDQQKEGTSRLVKTSRRFWFDPKEALRRPINWTEDTIMHADHVLNEFINNAHSHIVVENKTYILFELVAKILCAIDSSNQGLSPELYDSLSFIYDFEKKIKQEGNMPKNVRDVEHLILSWHQGRLINFVTGKLEGNAYHFKGTMTHPKFQNHKLGLMLNGFLAKYIFEDQKKQGVTDLYGYARMQNIFTIRILFPLFKTVRVSLPQEAFEAFVAKLARSLGLSTHAEIEAHYGTLIINDPDDPRFQELSRRNGWVYEHGFVRNAYGGEVDLNELRELWPEGVSRFSEYFVQPDKDSSALKVSVQRMHNDACASIISPDRLRLINAFWEKFAQGETSFMRNEKSIEDIPGMNNIDAWIVIVEDIKDYPMFPDSNEVPPPVTVQVPEVAERSRNGLILNYVGMPSASLNSFQRDSGLAQLISVMQRRGFPLKVNDYSTLTTMQRLTTPELRKKLVQLWGPYMESIKNKEPFSDALKERLNAVNDMVARVQAEKEDELAEELIAEIQEQRPLFIGAKLWQGDSTIGTMRMLKRIHERFPELPIVCGGPNVTFAGKEFMSTYPFVTFAITREADMALPYLTEYLIGQRSVEKVPNLLYRTSDGSITSNFNALITDIDNLPGPDHFSLNYRIMGDTDMINSITLDNERGCVNDCIYCVIRTHQGVRRERTAVQIVDEMENAYREHGTRYFRMGGPNTSYTQVQAIAREIKRRRLKGLYWTAFTTIHGADEQVLREAYRAGLRALFTGIESASPEFHKKFTGQKTGADEIRDTVNMMKRIGLFVTGSFIVGYPSPNEEKDWLATKDLIQNVHFDSVQLLPFFPFPGTKVFKHPPKELSIKMNASAFRKQLMGFKFNWVNPASMGNMPYSSNGKDFSQLLQLVGKRTQELSQAGIPVGIDGDIAVLSMMIGISPAQFVQQYQHMHFTRDVEGIRDLIAQVNTALKPSVWLYLYEKVRPTIVRISDVWRSLTGR